MDLIERDVRARERAAFVVGMTLGAAVMLFPILALVIELHHTILTCTH